MSQHSQHNPGTDRPLRQLFLLLFTATVSFALGVVIGRSSAPVQPIIKVTMPAGEVQPAAAQNFNFYKDLPKGETTALGSGINHQSAFPVEAPLPATTVSHAEETIPAPAVIEVTATPPVTPTKSGKEQDSGKWILQASSYPREQDAQSLSQRLRSKGYKTEVKPVQIKGKTWFRLYVGPYSSAAAAKEAAAKLSRQEKLAPLSRKL